MGINGLLYFCSKLDLLISQVSFNPITVNSMKKALSRICKAEQREVSAEQIELIAKASGGDIRNAITSLQYFCLKPHQGPSLSSYDGISPCVKEGSDEMVHFFSGPSLSFGRDDTISLFHALGKFLHNKRDPDNPTAAGSFDNSFSLSFYSVFIDDRKNFLGIS